MTHVETSYASSGSGQNWFRRAENWLDDKGKGAWIAAMVLGFIFVWPVGLALLFYMIWSKKMFAHKSRACRQNRHATYHAARAVVRPSGNIAFDAYKEETLKRLESEQDQFESFLERLRAAKDKAEFDQFMEDRTKKAAESRDEITDEDAEKDTKEEA